MCFGERKRKEPFPTHEPIEILTANLSTFVNFPNFVICCVRVHMLSCSLVSAPFFLPFQYIVFTKPCSLSSKILCDNTVCYWVAKYSKS